MSEQRIDKAALTVILGEIDAELERAMALRVQPNVGEDFISVCLDLRDAREDCELLKDALARLAHDCDITAANARLVGM